MDSGGKEDSMSNEVIDLEAEPESRITSSQSTDPLDPCCVQVKSSGGELEADRVHSSEYNGEPVQLFESVFLPEVHERTTPETPMFDISKYNRMYSKEKSKNDICYYPEIEVDASGHSNRRRTLQELDQAVAKSKTIGSKRNKPYDRSACPSEQENTDRYFCHLCLNPKEFSSLLAVKNHVAFYHMEDEAQLPCFECKCCVPKQIFDTKGALFSHKSMMRSRDVILQQLRSSDIFQNANHSGEFKCDVCNKTFDTAEAVNNHVKFSHVSLSSGS